MAEPLEVIVGQLLLQHKLTLALAESCTGGLVGHRITDVPGSSVYLLGGIVAYSYDAKELLLRVRHTTLYDHGAVSAETAIEMARGVRRALGADIGISVTGIAGPGGGLPDKPVGLVYICLSARNFEQVEKFVWNEDRAGNKWASSEAALQMLRDYLVTLTTT
jgi:nicotinamide-nucleotide amidase